MALRHRAETINTQLAILISRLGVEADAETIQVHGKERPDVIFEMRGLRVVVEGKFADQPSAKETVRKQALERIRTGIAHIVAAVVYPEVLRTVPTSKLEARLETASLSFLICSEVEETKWFDSRPAGLMDALRRAQESLAEDDIVEKTAKQLSMSLDSVAKLWAGQEGTCDRLSSILGITIPEGEKPSKAASCRETAAKVSALVLANALIFQEQLAAANPNVLPLGRMESEKNTIDAVRKQWRYIWQKINYGPIFQLGDRILQELTLLGGTLRDFRILIRNAQGICKAQAALRHDLMGRIFHWLLHQAKYLGTYYTSVSAATLLTKLVMAADWNRDFGNIRQLESFKVVDLACGTGTLLMAVSQAISDQYILSRAKAGKSLNPVDLKALHKALMENILHGYDVLPSAVHLTASTLALLAPEVAFVRMNLFAMPLGVHQDGPRLGSLDFFNKKKEVPTQLTLNGTHAEIIRSGAAEDSAEKAFLPQIDLCVMNPPFVRSVGGNLLFGSLPNQREELQTELKKRVKRVSAKITAGLGAVFVALADEHLAQNGRLAFVLPAALASGEAWAETRKLIADGYHLETVVSSHDPDRPNFSENTDLSEILFIARKKELAEPPNTTTYINLWHNPRSIHEALDLANRIIAPNTHDAEGTETVSILSPHGKLGEIVHLPESTGGENWSGALFAQTGALHTFSFLNDGLLKIPMTKESTKIKTCSLNKLGEIGFDRRDIHDAFTPSADEWSPHKAFWNHKADETFTIRQSSNKYLIPRSVAAKGRPLRDAKKIWEKAGNILLAESLWPITQRVLALGFPEPIIGNTWWAFKPAFTNDYLIKSLLIWLNSSCSITMLFGRRVVTRSAWVQMKKPAWVSMPVLDVRGLSEKALGVLAAAYDKLCEAELLPLAQLDNDPIRKAIDDSISEALDLPDLAPLRELLSREPGLTGKKITEI